VNVADVGKEVVLNLMIETATVPCQQPAICAKVASGFELVAQWVVFHHESLLCGRVTVVFHHVSGLENQGQCQSTDEVHQEPSKDHLTGRKSAEGQRNAHHHRVVQDLSQGDSEEQVVVRLAHALEQTKLSVAIQGHIVLKSDPNEGH